MKIPAMIRAAGIIVTMVLSSGLGQTAAQEVNATGLRPPTTEERAWMDNSMEKTRAVRFNALGKARSDAALAAQNLPPMPPTVIVPVGQESQSDPKASGSVVSTEDPPPDLGTSIIDVSTVGLPAAVDNSTLVAFPEVRSQGSIGSCASFSTTYYVATHMTGLLRGWSNNNTSNTRKFSPKWTYPMVNGGGDNGSWFTPTFDVLTKLGAATWEDWAYSGTNTPSSYLEWCRDSATWRKAAGYRFNSSGIVSSINTQTGLDAAKALLNNGYLLLYATDIYGWQLTTLGNDPATSADNSIAGQRVASMVKTNSSGHAMTIVGYSDDAWTDVNKNGSVDSGEKGAFKIVNSWGTGWENAGFAWISYDALRTTSAVTNGDNTNRANGSRTAFWYNEVYWITARTSYTPTLLGEFTINTAKRNQVKIKVGRSATSTTTPSVYYPTAASFTPRVFENLGGAYALDGTSTAVAGTFVFDFTDIVSSGTQRYYLEINDNSAGSAATVSSFRLISPTGSVLATATNGIPLSADATTSRSYVDFAFGAAPVITSATTATGRVAQSFSYSITASNTPTSFSATNLPPGLSISTSTGVISGTPTQAGTFSVALGASNASGTGTGSVSITVQPALVSAPSITSATTASGTVGTAFSYQIAATNTPASFGATSLPPGITVNTTTGLLSGTPTQAGTFTVNLSATNGGGTGTRGLTVTIAPAPINAPVISSPGSATGVSGSAFTYRIEASNSPTSFGATGLPSGLSINISTGYITGNLPVAQVYAIVVSATNSGGTGYKNLTLTVTGDSSFGPANDAFANRQQLSGSAATATGGNVNATAETGEPAHAGYVASKSVWWAWTAPSNGPVTMKTVGSSYDTLLAVYTGSAVGSLTAVASDDDSGGNRASQVTFTGVSGTVYKIAVDGYAGATGSISLTVQQTGTTGPANNNFASATAVSGSTVAATGTNQGANAETGEPSHAGYTAQKSVWWTWTAPFSGQAVIDTIGSNFDTLLAVYTGSAINSLTSVASDDQSGGNNTSRVSFLATSGATYRIAIDGWQGAAGNVALNILLSPTGPPNDRFVNASTMSGSTTTVTGTNVDATAEAGEPLHFGRTPLKSVWWRWTAPSSGQVTLTTVGSPFDTILAVYTGSTVSALTSLASDDDSGGSATSRVVFQATSGITYSFAVDSYSSSSQGAITLNLALLSLTANDNFANRTLLTGSAATASGVSTNATAESGEPAHAGITASKSLWWRWVAPQSGTLVVNTSGSSFDTVLAVYTGTAVNALVQRVSDDDGGDGLASRVSFNVTAGVNYAIAVDGFGGASGTVALSLTFTPSNDLYFTNFEAFSEGSNQLTGNDGWVVSNNTGGVTGIFQGFAGTKTAWIGYNPTTDSSEYAYIPLNYDPVASGTPILRFSTRMQIVDSTNGRYDSFAYYLYNIPQDRVCGIEFDNANLHIYRYNGSSYVDTGVTFSNSQSYELVVTMNFQTNQWSATLGGVTLFTNQSMNVAGAQLTLGDIDPWWDISTTGNPGNNYMVFDDYRIAISTASPPAITSTLTRSVTAGQSFTYNIVASNTPTSYSATSLPSGLSVNTTSGLISGTPTVPGVYNVTIGATNSSGSDFKTLVITVQQPPPLITSLLTAQGRVGQAFSYNITASGSPTSYSATGLPEGTSVSTSTGLISGTPTAAGLFSVTIGATNSGGTGSATLEVNVLPAVAVITSAGTANAVVGTSFNYQITATGRVDSFTAAPLPAGLSFNSISGVIGGTPTTPSTVIVALGAVNPGGTGTKNLTITVASNITSAPVITSPGTAQATTGLPFNYTIQASSSPTSFLATGLPAGVTINTTTGAISGTPTGSGTFNVQLSATNIIGTGNKALTLTIQQVASFVKRSLPKSYSPNASVAVSLEAKPTAGQAWAIEEAIPAGWTATNISDGGSFAAGKVRFGPFTTSANKVLTYRVQVPADATAPGNFTGVASSGGVSSPISGRTELRRADTHDADTDGDNKLTLDEITQYATAWQQGDKWGNEDDEIPMDYVVRANALWKNGEDYVYDPNVPDGPEWWVATLPGSRLSASESQNVSAAGVGTATSTIPTSYVAGTAFTVQVNAAPTTGVSSYAVEDEVPPGWAVSAMSHGALYDSNTNKVKWGPFNDDVPRVLTYNITPPAGTTGVFVLSGFAAFDGIATPVGGSRQISSSGGPQAAAITSPTPFSLLDGASVTFTWDSGVGATSFALWAGSTANSYDLYAGNEGTNHSRTLTLPTDGRIIYVTLHSLIGGAYQTNTYLYTAFNSGTPVKAQITSPPNGSTLSTASLPLTWNSGVGVTQRYLFVGTSVGGYNIYIGNLGSTIFDRTITIPPGSGEKVYVSLCSLINGVWLVNNYVYKTQPSTKAVLVSPGNGATLLNGTLDLSWTTGVNVNSYAVWVGSSYGTYDLGAVGTTATSRNFTVPQDGSPIYVTLWSLINGAFQPEQYWFTAAPPVSGNRPSRVLSPANTTALTSTTVNVSWDTGVGVTSRALWVGSYPDGYDLYAAAETGSERSVVIPGDGRRIYVTLWSLISGVWQGSSYTYLGPNLPDGGAAQIATPTPGSTLTDGTLSLTWNAVAGATKYYLFVGRTPGAYDLFIKDEGLGTSRTVSGMPVDGRPIYVTLWSVIRGVWKSNNVFYTTANTATGNRPALINSHPNGSTFVGPNPVLTWSNGVGVTGLATWIGSSPYGYDLWVSTESLIYNYRSVAVPTDGRKVYVTFWSQIGGVWQNVCYQYTTDRILSSKPALTSHLNGATFTSATEYFTWTFGQGSLYYYLFVGSTPGGSDLFIGNQGLAQYATVPNLPRDGSPVYLTIWTNIGGTWQSSEYLFTSWLAP